MKSLLSLLLAGIISALSAQTLPNLPIPIGAGTAEVWNDSLYLFGGSSHWWGTTLYPRIYKFDGIDWSYQDSIPDNSVWGAASVLVGDDVYLLGGWPSGAGLLRKYDMPNHTWSYLNSSSNQATYGITAEYLNGFIYLFNPLQNVFAYDIANNTWSTKTPNSKQGYAGLGSILFQDEIYIVGCVDSSFFKYTPSTDQWTELAHTPYQVAGCSMGIIDDLIYCAGGYSPAPGGLYNSVMVYDISTDSWTVDNFQISAERQWMAAAEYEGRLYVIGGFDSVNLAVDVVEEIIPLGPVGIDAPDPISVPANFSLEQNYPNPFNPTTTIKLTVPEAAEVNLSIYDIMGRMVRTLINENLPAGNHSVLWDGKDEAGNLLSSGIYFYRLHYQGRVQTKRMALLK